MRPQLAAPKRDASPDPRPGNRLIAGSIGIERQFIIQPGANAGNIAISYHGIDDMTIDEQGSLAIGTVLGKRREGFSQSSSASAGVPVINFFDVAPTSTLPGQAAIGTLSVSGATSATLNGVEAHCSNGQCAGTVLFYPTSTTDYVLGAAPRSRQPKICCLLDIQTSRTPAYRALISCTGYSVPPRPWVEVKGIRAMITLP